jgi:hypothetical protein
MSIMFMYYCMWQNEKLNFVALILDLSSNLFLVQIFSGTAQLTIVILIQLSLAIHLLSNSLITLTAHCRASPRHTLAVRLASKLQCHYFAVSCKASSAAALHTLHINLTQSKPAEHAARSLLATACSCTSSMAHGHVHDKKIQPAPPTR